MRHLGLALALLVSFSSLSQAAGADDANGEARTVAHVGPAIAACLARPKPDDTSTDKPCTDKANTACQKANNYTTVAMVECTDAAVNFWRGVVERRTEARLALHNPEITQYVQWSDPVWKRYIDTRCSVYSLLQGTMWRPIGVGCVLDITMTRASDLELLDPSMLEKLDPKFWPGKP